MSEDNREIRPFVEPVNPDLRGGETTPLRVGERTMIRPDQLLGASYTATNMMKLYLRGGHHLNVSTSPWKWRDRRPIEEGLVNPPSVEKEDMDEMSLPDSIKGIILLGEALATESTGAFFVQAQRSLVRIGEVAAVRSTNQSSLTPVVGIYYRDGTMQKVKTLPRDYDQTPEEFVDMIGQFVAAATSKETDREYPEIDPMVEKWGWGEFQ